jgi:chromosome partitioning related protein ParA
MRVVSVVSTKGGVGKTTVAANLGGLLADAGLRVLLLDLDSQPTLSSYYALRHEAVAGAYECIALNLTDPAQLISTTTVVGLDLILSNDDQARLSTLLLHAPDGWTNIKHAHRIADRMRAQRGRS